MSPDRLQAQRFEQKYIVNETDALAIRDFAQCHLDLDEYGVGKPDYSYPVHSLYLDSDDLRTYRDTINGNKNRFKLRLRFYNNHPDAPVFFEIKRRMNNCIRKQRGGVRRHMVERLLAGELPTPEQLVSRDPKHFFAVQNFCHLMQAIQAAPKVHVAYVREAYVPHDDNSSRLTLDRLVRTEPELTARLSTQMINPRLVWGKAVVLELKFTDRFPKWFGELVRTFNLQQCGAAKYADGITIHNGKIPRHKHMPPLTADFNWPTENAFPVASPFAGPASPAANPLVLITARKD